MDASAPKEEGQEQDAGCCCNYYAQLFLLCSLEIAACISLYVGHQADYATLQGHKGNFSWVGQFELAKRAESVCSTSAIHQGKPFKPKRGTKQEKHAAAGEKDAINNM